MSGAHRLSIPYITGVFLWFKSGGWVCLFVCMYVIGCVSCVDKLTCLKSPKPMLPSCSSAMNFSSGCAGPKSWGQVQDGSCFNFGVLLELVSSQRSPVLSVGRGDRRRSGRGQSGRRRSGRGRSGRCCSQARRRVLGVACNIYFLFT